ncbi:hypothetical protein [Bradyrhizobium liaoningense]
MQSIQLEPGMRVRCVDAGGCEGGLYDGNDYTIDWVGMMGDMRVVLLKEIAKSGHYLARRFKPIIRVKAPSRRVISLVDFERFKA